MGIFKERMVYKCFDCHGYEIANDFEGRLCGKCSGILKEVCLFEDRTERLKTPIIISDSDAEDINYTMLPNTISVNDKLLTIQMDSMGDVPKVWYEGKEITGRVHISFDWKTKDTRINPTYFKIKHVGKDSSKLDIRTIIHNNDTKDCR